MNLLIIEITLIRKPNDPEGDWWELWDEKNQLPYYYHTRANISNWVKPMNTNVISLVKIRVKLFFLKFLFLSFPFNLLLFQLFFYSTFLAFATFRQPNDHVREGRHTRVDRLIPNT